MLADRSKHLSFFPTRTSNRLGATDIAEDPASALVCLLNLGQ